MSTSEVAEISVMAMDPSFTTLGATILQLIIEKSTVKGILHLHNKPFPQISLLINLSQVHHRFGMTSWWWLNKVEMRGTCMLPVEDKLGRCLQRDACPLHIYVCYGSVACSMRKGDLRQRRGLFELNRK